MRRAWLTTLSREMKYPKADILEMTKKKLPKQSPLKQIRKQCLECCGGSVKSVRFCHAVDCPLLFLRFGKYPKTFLRENGNKSEQLFDKDNFKKGAKFCPDKDESSYRV